MVDLPNNYYLVNFRELIGFVARAYPSLLTDIEKDFVLKFDRLTEDAQRLYIRLLCRTKSVYRACKLVYEEIGSIPDATHLLQDQGFLKIDPALELDALLALYTRTEILSKLSLGNLKNIKRAALDHYVLTELVEEEVSAALVDQETIVEVLCQDHFDVLRLCFFGNLYQDMTDFVLRDLGLTRYEQYSIDQKNLPFKTRAQIEAHLKYYQCVGLLDDMKSLSDSELLTVHQQLPEASEWDSDLQRRCERFTNTIARQLERLKNYPEALNLYQSNTRPPSRERQARILVETDRIQEALDLCLEILEQSVNEEELVFAQQFSARIAKKHKIDWPQSPKYNPPVERLQLHQTGLSIEETAALYYNDEGHCFYTENTLFNGVFGLAIWDIIFAPVPGVFFNPFQNSPADFYEPQFKDIRSKNLESRFAEISTTIELSKRVQDSFERKHGIQNPLVNWHDLTDDLLQMSLERIPIHHWQAIFKRLLVDLRHHRTGFTDLILFPDSGGYELIEIKGPGDTLQKNQIRWMHFFAENKIPHKVTHVSWLEPVDALD